MSRLHSKQIGEKKETGDISKLKETGDVSKSQTYGAMKKGTCTICGNDVSKLSYEKQTAHAKKCAGQMRLI